MKADIHPPSESGAPGGSGSSDAAPSETGAGGDGGSSDVLRELRKFLGEEWEYFLYYASIKGDQTRLFLRTLVLRALLWAFGAAVAAGMMIIAGWFIATGLSEGFGMLFQSRWLGNFVAGIVMMGGVTLGIILFFEARRKISLKRTIQKYEDKQRQQRAKFGRDVASRARAASK